MTDLSTEDTAHALMNAVGPVLGEVEILFLDTSHTHVILFPNEVEVFVGFDEDRRCLVVWSELGDPPETDEKLSRFFLVVNNMWVQTGGLRFALSDKTGPVTMLLDIGVDALDPNSLANLLRDFVQRTLLWTGIVANGPPDNMTPEQDGGAFVRV